MDTHPTWNAARGDSVSREGGTYLDPVLARAAELRRGPAGLLRLLRARGTGEEARARLAKELDRAVGRAGVRETLVESVRPA